MHRIAHASVAVSLLFAGMAHAETAPAGKRVTYACDQGNVIVTYPPEAKAKTDRVRIVLKDKWSYALRPVPGGEKWEHKTLKVVFEPKGDEAIFEREGKPLAEKCKIKTST